MTHRGKVYARSLLVDQNLVGENTSNVPEGAELNKRGQKLLNALHHSVSPRRISHYCLMPMHRLKKISPDQEGVDQNDVCIFGGFLGEGLYGETSSVVTSPIVILDKEKGKVFTQSGSIYKVGQEVSESAILEMFYDLPWQLRE